MNIPKMPPAVSTILEGYPEDTRKQLTALRKTIFDVAAKTEGVGALEETLKWGQISYLTPKTKSGTTLRIDAIKDNAEQIGMFVHCQTTLVDTFRRLYGELFEFEGDRCVRFTMNPNLPIDAVEHCIALALTYHLDKKANS